MGAEMNRLQKDCESALNELAINSNVKVSKRHLYRDINEDIISLNIGEVLINISPDQVDIITPYNGRCFELDAFKNEKELIDKFLVILQEFVKDPDKGKHPFYRFYKWLTK